MSLLFREIPAQDINCHYNLYYRYTGRVINDDYGGGGGNNNIVGMM